MVVQTGQPRSAQRSNSASDHWNLPAHYRSFLRAPLQALHQSRCQPAQISAIGCLAIGKIKAFAIRPRDKVHVVVKYRLPGSSTVGLVNGDSVRLKLGLQDPGYFQLKRSHRQHIGLADLEYVLGVCTGNHQQVPPGQWKEVHEGHYAIVSVHEGCGRVAARDETEYARVAGIAHRYFPAWLRAPRRET